MGIGGPVDRKPRRPRSALWIGVLPGREAAASEAESDAGAPLVQRTSRTSGRFPEAVAVLWAPSRWKASRV